MQGDYRIAKLLIENAANLEAVGDLGNRPLHVAASGGHTQVIAPVHIFDQACCLLDTLQKAPISWSG